MTVRNLHFLDTAGSSPEPARVLEGVNEGAHVQLVALICQHFLNDCQVLTKQWVACADPLHLLDQQEAARTQLSSPLMKHVQGLREMGKQ